MNKIISKNIKGKMVKLKVLFIFFSSIFLFSCGQNQEISIYPKWEKLELQHGWTLYAPKQFTTQFIQGVDSEPGIINSNQDSIYLEYDSGIENIENRKFSFQKSYECAKRDIDSGFFKEHYKIPTKHKAYLDTIDNKVAIIITPTIRGCGTTSVTLLYCDTGEWLGIKGTNLTIEKEKLVLKIFKTIKLKP